MPEYREPETKSIAAVLGWPALLAGVDFAEVEIDDFSLTTGRPSAMAVSLTNLGSSPSEFCDLSKGFPHVGLKSTKASRRVSYLMYRKCRTSAGTSLSCCAIRMTGFPSVCAIPNS